MENSILRRKYTEEDVEILNKLYPSIEPSYFKDKTDIFKKTESSIVEKFVKSKVKPYIKSVDLNNSVKLNEENKPKKAYEIGIKIEF